MRTRQTGYSLLEITVAVGIVTAVGAAAATAVVKRASSSRLDKAVEEVRGIAIVADQSATRITSTTVDPATGIYSHNYGFRKTTWTNIGVLNDETNLTLPVNSPFGTPYEYQTGNRGAVTTVRFVVPNPDDNELIFPRSLVTTAPATGDATMVTYTLLRGMGGIRSQMMARAKRDQYLEELR